MDLYFSSQKAVKSEQRQAPGIMLNRAIFGNISTRYKMNQLIRIFQRMQPLRKTHILNVTEMLDFPSFLCVFKMISPVRVINTQLFHGYRSLA